MTNAYGTTGFARVTSCSHGVAAAATAGFPISRDLRIHLCKFNPCRVTDHINNHFLYRNFGPPTHVQPSTWIPPRLRVMPIARTLAKWFNAPAKAGSAQLLAPALRPPPPPPTTPSEPPPLTAVAGLAVAVAPPPPPAAPSEPSPPEDPSVAPAKTSVESKAPAAGLSSKPKACVAVSIEQKPADAAAAPEPTGADIRLLRAAPPLDDSLSSTQHIPRLAAVLTATPPVPSPARLPAHRVPLAASSGVVILDQLLALSRSIRGARQYVGYSAFVLFGLRFEVRPVIWEGEERIDLLDTFAPWALERCTKRCAVDAVTCCMVPRSGGHGEMVPVSEAHPLSQCRHFVACATLGIPLSVPGTSIESFYQRLGQVVLGTVTDGDCGLDVMSQMIDRSQSSVSFTALREELAEYMVPRIKLPWMQDLMAALREIDFDDLKLSLIHI